MADYTLPYQKNHDLDYEFIANKCENLVQGIGEFDARLHQMDSNENKTLIYYFKYVKKNLYLISAIDHIPGIYESQCTEKFEKLHERVEKTARKEFREINNLSRCLTRCIAECMRDLNPPCKEELEGVILTNADYNSRFDLESAQGETAVSATSGISSYFEIELQNIAVAIQRVAAATRKSTEELSWFQFIFGQTQNAQLQCFGGIISTVFIVQIASYLLNYHRL